jgi:hypothetical protein
VSALATTNGSAAGNGIVEAPVRAANRIVVTDESQFANLLDTARFDHMYRVANIFAASDMVPQQFRQKPADCFIAIQMAVRLGVDPFMFMQKTYVVGGKPGMEAQLAIALVNARGPFKGSIQWKLEGEGMTRQATAYAHHKDTGELCECTVSMAIAQAEGWLGKGGSKWKTMPDQMLRYRSAAWLARLYAPECLMGMQTLDELEDIDAPAPSIASLPVGRTSFRAPEIHGSNAEHNAAAESESKPDPAPEVVDKGTGEVKPETKDEPKETPAAETKPEPAKPEPADKSGPSLNFGKGGRKT